jgi:hypothetical protein
MIHCLQVQTLQIRDVSGRVEGHYLPSSFVKQLVPADKPIENQATLRWPIPLGDDILPVRQIPYLHR